MTQLAQSSNFVYQTDSGEVKLNPATVRSYLVNGNGKITDQEVMMFIGLCKGQKLNPFTKEVYLIKYGDKSPATMVVSKDVFMKRAAKHPDFNGLKSGVIVLKNDEVLESREGGFYLKGKEQVVGAWAEVHRKSWGLPVRTEVAFDEYAGYTNDGKLNSNWSKRPSTMIMKVAESHALRKAFVEDLQGMYDETEMNVEVENVVAVVPETPEKTEAKKLQESFVEANSQEVVEGNDLF